MKKFLLVPVLTALFLTACATAPDNSVSNYAPGDDSAALKAGRNRASAQLSQAELEQHRRQRTNVSEEMDLEEKKRQHKTNQIKDAVGIGGAIFNIFR